MYDSINNNVRSLYELQKSSFEYVQILGTLDTCACPQCALLDGALIKTRDAVVGKTVPPFHEGCRCCIVAFSVEMYNGEGEKTRFARDPLTRQGYKVPAQWTFLDWYSSLSDNQRSYFSPEVCAAIESQLKLRKDIKL